MEWEAPEHMHRERSNDWYAAVVVIAAVLVAAEIYWGNYLVIIITVLSACGILIIAKKPPKLTHVTISKTGIKMGTYFYPFSSLDAYAVVNNPNQHMIILESTKSYLPLIVIPIAEEVDPEEVQELLGNSLPNKDLREPFAHQLADYLGF